MCGTTVYMFAPLPMLLAVALGAPSPRPRPAPELGQLRFFEGAWTCTGAVAATAGGPTQAVSVKTTVKLQPDRFWFSVQASEQKSKTRPLPRDSQGFWGYDPVNRVFLRMLVGNLGEWESATSAGWEGDDLVWSGDINNLGGEAVRLRQTITKQGPREYTDKVELNIRGDWLPLATSACKR